MFNRYKVGQLGEDYAKTYLQDKGYRIVAQHHTSQWGELDIVAKKSNKLVFIEVKTRVGLGKGYPFEAVTRTKVMHLMRSIQYFLLKNDYRGYKLSLDVVSVLLNQDYTLKQIKHYETLLPNL